MKYLLFVALFAFDGCGGTTPSPTPTPQPPPKPVPTVDAAPLDDGCQAAANTLQRLRCPEWSATYAADCRVADQKLAALPGGHPPGNHACTATSQSCAAARACK